MKLLINQNTIDWSGTQSYYFFNPKHPKAKQFKSLSQKLPFFESHIYLFTSSCSKICLLSKKAVLFSAKQANQNLQASKKDKWLITLPLFHVSGVSILARAYLSECSYKINSQAWDPHAFLQIVKKERITLSSLVPAQVYDLVNQSLKAPKSLRAVLVGGDHLSSSLYKQARDLGWPLLICYGATETCSHIACSSLNSLNKKSFPQLPLLKGVQTKLTLIKPAQVAAIQAKGKQTEMKRKPQLQKTLDLQNLKIKSEGLLTAYYILKTNKLYDPKDNRGYFVLPDQLILKKNQLIVKASPKDKIKILGETVDLKKLRGLLERLSKKWDVKVYLLTVPDKRQGAYLVLFGETCDFEKAFNLIQDFNALVLAYERVQSFYCQSLTAGTTDIKRLSFFS